MHTSKPLTNKNKKSIIIHEGFVIVTRVWKRFQTVVTKRIGSTLNVFLKLRPLGRRRYRMNMSFKKMNGRFATVLAVAVTALTLAACGGGGGADSTPVVVTPTVGAVPVQPSKAVVPTGLCTPPSEAYTTATNGQCLVTDTGPVRAAAKSAPRASQAVVPPITANELFDWAQATFPTVFPAPSTTISATGFVYRYYASTNSYAAVADDGGVYVLFANGDNIVKYIAQIEAFSCLVKPAAVGCAPVLTMTSVSPLPVTSPIVLTSNQPLKSIDSVSILSSTNGSVAGSASMSQDKLSITITPTSVLPYSATLTITVKATSEANVQGSVVATVTTAQAPQGSWWPPTFVPMGTKVYLDSTKAPAGAVVNGTFPGQTQSGLLPADCKITGDECWKEAVRNGTIKFLATTAKNPNQPTRPIAFGFYKTVSTILWPGKLAYCEKPFFADDGTLVAPNDPVENRCVLAEHVFAVGNNFGEIIQQKNYNNGVIACFQQKYNTSLDGWDYSETPCP